MGEFIKLKAFTLAEVLITLAVIGVVSALVIPNVLKNYNDKKYNTARLKALKTFGEAGKMASINGEINGQPTAKDFVNNVFSKYLKIIKVCDTAAECNFPSQIQPLNSDESKISSDASKSWGTLSNQNNTKNNWTDISNINLSTYISTADGFSAKLFYNPKCIRNTHDGPYSCNTKECEIAVMDSVCINVIYDMNGTKSPNHVGKDIGYVTVLWSGLNTAAAAPGLMPYEEARKMYDEKNSLYYQEAIEACNSHSHYNLPNSDEMTSIAINRFPSSWQAGYFWTGTIVLGEANTVWRINHNVGDTSRIKVTIGPTRIMNYVCVRR